jgi:BMFP domain-containing protein YqiC
MRQCSALFRGALDRRLPELGAPRCVTFSPMIDRRFFDELNERIGEAFRNSPAQDVEKNLKAMLASGFARLDLVLREDFEVQQKLLERAQAKLAELEARISELESKRHTG